MTALDAAPGKLRLPRPVRPGFEVLVVCSVAAVALLLALVTDAHHPATVLAVARGALASLVLFLCCGDALAFTLVPRDLGVPAPLFALPLGAAVSGLVLTVFGFAHVPLSVSLWVTLAGGVAASALVRRRQRARRTRPETTDRRALLPWIAVLVLMFCVAMIPAWRTTYMTIYGENPDAQQVVGSAILFQHVPPTATDYALPLDTVPPAWRFRYPILYALAGASNLAHFDPIRVFPSMAAVLVLAAVLGFAAFAVTCLRAPARAGPAIAAVVGFSVITLHLAWHPYWNQLWGLAMLPYAILFGWRAVEKLDVRAAILFVLLLVTATIAYPLVLPYPLLIVGALAIALRRRPRLPSRAQGHRWLVALVGVLVLAPALAGAAVKIEQGAKQLIDAHGALWGGDVTHFMPVGGFVGTGGGVLPLLAVVAVAVFGLTALPRRIAWALGAVIVVLFLFDIRLRLAPTGPYMDFKHLSFTGAIVVAMAAATVARLLSGGRGRALLAGAVLALAWTTAAVIQDHREIVATNLQVTPEMFQIRQWASELPRGASVRVDVPPSGVQLWAVYMLGDHPVDTAYPLIYTTYAHAVYGLRASYSLALRYYLNPKPGVEHPIPAQGFARNPPLRINHQFVLRRIVWPARLAHIPDNASTALVEP